MRKQLIAAFCAVLVVIPSAAQMGLRTDSPEVDKIAKADVLQAEAAFHQAKLQSDVPALDRLMAPDFISINQWGVVRDKVSELKLYHHLKVTSLVTSDEQVRVTGDIATVLGVMSTSSITGMGRFLFLETFVKRDGRWLILSVTHNFKVDPDTMHTFDPGPGPEAVSAR